MHQLPTRTAPGATLERRASPPRVAAHDKPDVLESYLMPTVTVHQSTAEQAPADLSPTRGRAVSTPSEHEQRAFRQIRDPRSEVLLLLWNLYVFGRSFARS